MEAFELFTTQKPGQVTFENYETIRENLTNYVEDFFGNVDYDVQGYEAAKADRDELKKNFGHLRFGKTI